MKTIVIAMCLVSSCLALKAQQKTNMQKLNYHKHPYWIQMVADSSVNYFEAVKAFGEFWKKRKVPVENDAIIDGKSPQEEKWTTLRKLLHHKEYKDEKTAEQYSFEYKRFKHWQIMVEPFVQPDGRILSADEQLEIWKHQRQ
jgi:hypothetical protein